MDERVTAAQAQEEYRAELTEAIDLLTGAAQELQDPLRHLVQGQVDRAAPYGRAAIVLAFAAPPESRQPAQDGDGQSARGRRIYLAAALEMLFIAHQIHKLLLAPESETMDKSIMGSTILTGDLCYSRAAAMAVQTDSTEVVRIFSEALKRVSEGNLRSIFSQTTETFDETESLFASGIHAARVLTGSAVPAPESRETLAAQLAGAYADPHGVDLTRILENPLLQPEERLRVQAFFAAI